MVAGCEAAPPPRERGRSEVDAVKIPVVLARASDGVMLKEVLATERGDAASAPPAAPAPADVLPAPPSGNAPVVAPSAFTPGAKPLY